MMGKIENTEEKMKINYGVGLLETDKIYQSGVIINAFLKKKMSTKPRFVSESSLIKFIRDVRVS